MDTRKLVYDFYELPFYRRIKIARNMELLEEEECKDIGGHDEEMKLFKMMFKRAGQRRLLKDLRFAVGKEMEEMK